MSSKSRYSKKSKTPSTTVEHVDGGQAQAPTLEDFEEYVHVPEGRSKTQFILLVALMIFLLIVFIVPTAFQGALTGGQDDGMPAVSFTTPEGTFTWTTTQFYDAKRTEDAFRRTIMPFMRSTPSHEEAATTLLLDQLAREAGVRVSDQDLREQLQAYADQLGGVQAYTDFLAARFPGGAQAFEKTVRRGIRIQRFLELTSRVAVAPTADRVAEAWADDHVEHAFDYVFAETHLWEDAAKAEAPTDEVLDAWFADRPDWERSQLETPETWSLGSAFYRLGDPEPAALLERYPLPEDFDVEAAGTSFYTANSYLVYKLDEPRTDDEGNEIRYAPEAEVAEQSRAAARVEAALAAWREDLSARRAEGEAVDLAVESQELGLGWRETPDAVDRPTLVADAEFGGGILASQLTSLAAGDLVGTVVVTEDVLQVAEVLAKVDPVLPPIAEIREDVLTRWARDRAKELAEEFLTDVVADTGSLDAEAFHALAQVDERLQSGMRDWLDKSAAPDADPDAFEPANLFLRSQAATLGLYDLAEGDLSDVALSATRDRVYVVRSRGARTMDFGQATPAQVAAIEDRLLAEARTTFRQAYMSSEDGVLPPYLVEVYQLALPASEEAERRRLEEEAKAAGEDAGTAGAAG